MIYNRRELLRHASMASITAAATTVLPALTGCRPKHSALTSPIGTGVFTPGIRVFFIGAWLFAPDPMGNGLLAMTLDLAGVHHDFPYGVWPGPGGIDGKPSLNPNPTATAQRNAYTVGVIGTTKPAKSVEALFKDAAQNFDFYAITNPNHDLSIDFTRASIRVVALPLPTQLLTADFLTGSFLSTDKNHPFLKQGGCSSSGSGCGIASAHIFEYQDASTLSFGGIQQIGAASTGGLSNFHFHTKPSGELNPHGPDMMQNLTNLIKGFVPVNLGVSIPHPNAKPVPGPNVPPGYDPTELDIPEAEKKTANIASCAGGFGCDG